MEKFSPEQRAINTLAEAISGLACALNGVREQTRIEFEWHKSHHGFVTKHDLDRWGDKIMQEIEQFSTDVNQAFDKLGLAVEGVSGDVAWLKEELKKLPTTPGPLSPEDVALLNGIRTRANDLADKLSALDSLTEQVPTPPVEPPAE